MDIEYHPQTLEAEIQAYWQSNNSFKAEAIPGKEKFYCLAMFPYPSGKLHMGHVRNYTLADVIARFQRLKGKQVLQPMGWDAFGLPAENAAQQHNTAPAAWTQRNIDDMRKQLKQLGFAYDWDREIATCHPDYYRWEQWFFIQLYNKGLVYKKKSVVNWDPIDQTVLANEQVIDGKGWRSGAPVERKEIPQWFLKITDYADDLLEDIKALDAWPNQVRLMQQNWIGKSVGVSIDFPLLSATPLDLSALNVYTTRPDTLMGVTYLAVAPQHPLCLHLRQENPELDTFIEDCNKIKVAEADMAVLEKKGLALGIEVKHPITGDAIPVWTANFVLMDYGSGAVMSVPAHDQRDWEFATAYDLPIRPVIQSTDTDVPEHDYSAQAFVEKGQLVQSGEFDGLTSEQAFDAIANALKTKNLGDKTVNYRLRDWGVSRQRYWGTPIPMIECNECGTQPVPDSDLPVVLPTDLAPNESGLDLKKVTEFKTTICPKCGGAAERETDTFDTFMESSWYYARFCCRDDHTQMLNEEAHYWLPVDHYVGGIEHAVLHLLYSRFFHKLMRDMSLVPGDEPFSRLLCQGMVVSETFYQTQDNGKKTYYFPDQVTVDRDDKGRALGAHLTADGSAVTMGGIEKMSKSKNNGVDPNTLIEQYGADTVRLFTLFAAPPDQSLEWSEAGVEGAHRFLKRLWRLAHQIIEHTADQDSSALLQALAPETALSKEQAALKRKVHQTLAKATHDIEERQTFNTAIAAVMELLNTLQKYVQAINSGKTNNPFEITDAALLRQGVEFSLLILAPITPHMSHHLWQKLGQTTPIHQQQWPQPDQSALKEESITWVVQVNGKVRAKLDTEPSISKDAITELALNNENTQKFIGDKTVVKTIVVPNKLVNFVVKG